MNMLLKDQSLIDQYWHFGCLGTELKAEGDYLLFHLLDREVALYHDGLEIIAFDNRCPHRGTRFFEEDQGSRNAVCKYHGWAYSKGRLVIPEEENLSVGGCRPELHRYQTQQCGSLLFFSLRPKSSLMDQLGDELFLRIESLSFDFNERKDFNHYIYECYWPIAIENALDPQHIRFVHATTLNRLSLINCQNKYWGESSAAYFDIGEGRVQKSMQSLTKKYDLSLDFHPGYMSIFLYPFTFISSTGGITYSIQNFFPRDESTSWFLSRLYSVNLADTKNHQINELVINSAIDMNRKVFEEDHSICRLISRQAWHAHLDKQLYCNEEKIIHFRQQLNNKS